jgi:hypothetical protein
VPKLCIHLPEQGAIRAKRQARRWHLFFPTGQMLQILKFRIFYQNHSLYIKIVKLDSFVKWGEFDAKGRESYSIIRWGLDEVLRVPMLLKG